MPFRHSQGMMLYIKAANFKNRPPHYFTIILLPALRSSTCNAIMSNIDAQSEHKKKRMKDHLQ